MWGLCGRCSFGISKMAWGMCCQKNAKVVSHGNVQIFLGEQQSQCPSLPDASQVWFECLSRRRCASSTWHTHLDEFSACVWLLVCERKYKWLLLLFTTKTHEKKDDAITWINTKEIHRTNGWNHDCLNHVPTRKISPRQGWQEVCSQADTWRSRVAAKSTDNFAVVLNAFKSVTWKMAAIDGILLLHGNFKAKWSAWSWCTMSVMGERIKTRRQRPKARKLPHLWFLWVFGRPPSLGRPTYHPVISR